MVKVTEEHDRQPIVHGNCKGRLLISIDGANTRFERGGLRCDVRNWITSVPTSVRMRSVSQEKTEAVILRTREDRNEIKINEMASADGSWRRSSNGVFIGDTGREGASSNGRK